MRDNFPPAGVTVARALDQADGLRRMFSGVRQHFIPIVANLHVTFAGVLLERVSTALANLGTRVLLVDAADASPALPDPALFDLAACVEQLDDNTAYLPARGLARAYVDTRGSAASLLDALAHAAPQADVVLLYGEVSDLARVFRRRDVRPVLLAADNPESLKFAYAACKTFAQRCGLMTFDLLLALPESSPRAAAIQASLAGCADRFLGSLLNASAIVDPAVDVAEPPSPSLRDLLAQQLRLEQAPGHPPGPTPTPHRDWHATTN